MDNNTRKILGLTDENITFPEDWLKDAKIKGVTAHFIPFRSGLAAFVNKVIFRRGTGGSALFSNAKKTIEKKISLSILTIIFTHFGSINTI